MVDRDLRNWRQQRQQVDGAAPGTINRNLSTLRRFFTWAVEQQLLVENPTKGIEDVPSVQLAPRSLPDEAVDASLRVARNEHDLRLRLRDEALLALLIYAGLRAQEICDIQRRNVDLASGWFGGEGVITHNRRVEQRKCVKFNHLVANCLIFYNVHVISEILEQLNREGAELDEQAVGALSPYLGR